MSLFGKSASSKTTVAPSSQVDALLKQIVANAQNMQNNDPDSSPNSWLGLMATNKVL